MRAFILLILIGTVLFVASILPARDMVESERTPEVVSDRLSVSILNNEENLQESVNKSPESERKDTMPALSDRQVDGRLEIIIIEEEYKLAQIEQDVIVEQPTVLQTEEELKPSFSEINTNTRKALVNILCTTKSGGLFKPITGSGIIINERGIILTNAHIAQYFLLQNYLMENFIECVIRTGSPARSEYKARPVFISPSWIKNNAESIAEQSPTGTGEDDYAFLLITGHTNPEKNLQEAFSFIFPEYDSDKIEVGNAVLLAAYPAGFLGGISIQKDLYVSSTITEVMELFTFGSGTHDLFSVGGSVVAQQGSSGGAVVSEEGKLLGIIVTSSVAESTQDRDLRAITIAHINRSFIKETGFDMQTLFTGDIAAEADAFNENIAPELTQLLEDELEK